MTERERITAWVTKYALTNGILLEKGEVCNYTSGTMFSYGTFGHAHGNDWHRTPEAAIARAEEMRKKKIESLKKQIAKLEKMTFAIPEKDED